MRKQVLLALAALIAFPCQALAAKADLTMIIPVFQGLLQNYNQELGRIDDLHHRLEKDGSDCAAVRNAAVIVESYKKSMLLAAGIQDLLVSYAFINTGFDEMNLYLWNRINRMRLQAFSYAADASAALQRLAQENPAFPLPILGQALERIQEVSARIKELEGRFARELPNKETPAP